MSLKQSSIDSATPRPNGDFALECWCRERNRACLRIETRAADVFLFPYAQLTGAEYTRKPEGEFMRIRFSTREVVVFGQNLSEIASALQEMAVDWIRPIPTRYINIAKSDGVKVMEIEVKDLDENGTSSE
jgi:hypothetical protein